MGAFHIEQHPWGATRRDSGERDRAVPDHLPAPVGIAIIALASVGLWSVIAYMAWIIF